MAINIVNRPQDDLQDDRQTAVNALWIVFAILIVAVIAYALYVINYTSPTYNYDTRAGQPLLSDVAPNTNNNDATNPSNYSPPESSPQSSSSPQQNSSTNEDTSSTTPSSSY